MHRGPVHTSVRPPGAGRGPCGHEAGNHSWNHPDLTELTPEQVASQLNRTSAAIKAATGKEPTLFRRRQRPGEGRDQPLFRAVGRGHRGLEVPRRRQGRPDRHRPGEAQRRRPRARHPPHVGRRGPADPAHPLRPRLPLRHRQPPARHPLTAGLPQRQEASW
ncbi:MAG: polysaccharide deacetylase family protein [Streptomyces sp.]|nr:polysaccharide deacetylase family protein [Streptomyces sp.]NUP41216.1 polysaccharide deacetylase family protein [Streptomyces sp.]